MSNKIIDVSAITQAVSMADTSGDYRPLLTVGPMKAGTLARISFWVNNLGSDSWFSIYRGADASGDVVLEPTSIAFATIVDHNPAAEYTLAYRGDQSTPSVIVTLSVDQIS